MKAINDAEAYPPHVIAPVLQYEVPASEHAIAGPVPNGGSVSSGILPSSGYKEIAVGVTSTQAGNITLQRYLDDAGTIAQGAALTVAMLAATPVVLNVADDGHPFQSYKITVSNSGGAPATLTNVIVLKQAK